MYLMANSHSLGFKLRDFVCPVGGGEGGEGKQAKPAKTQVAKRARYLCPFRDTRWFRSLLSLRRI